ncbi:hypothetical protein [Streptomyces echinatus]|uniref:Uncharacterized protein n=1 Tax=Streptomyces echinatus TaxID=67293 RepID=A0A7W9PRG0_9ACTN|nr:hypothetical protein [Streptomyces echinatus]MBB5926509.1 hypothetical protein [Streptomyces echinatus]
MSPSSGFTQGDLHGPQGLTADKHGNIWVPNWRARSITAYPAGNPAAAKSITAEGIDHPFVIATDQQGRAWINNLRGVTVLTPDGKPTLHSPITGGGMAGGKGITIDSLGNVWTSDSDTPSITEISSSGSVGPNSPIRAASLHRPWGIAVDGNERAGFARNFRRSWGIPGSPRRCGTSTSSRPGSRTPGPPGPSEPRSGWKG